MPACSAAKAHPAYDLTATVCSAGGAVTVAESAIRDGEQALYKPLAHVRLCAACALFASSDADHASEHLDAGTEAMQHPLAIGPGCAR